MKRQIKYILYVLVMIFLSSIFVEICINDMNILDYFNYKYVIEAEENIFEIENKYPKENSEYKFEHPVYRGEPYEIINPVYRGEPIEFKFLKN